MSNRAFALLGIVIVMILLAGSLTLNEAWAQHDAKVASNLVAYSESEQVKIFSAGVGDMEKLEKEVNAWLKENDGKIYIYSRTQSGTQFSIQIAIWYKVKK